MYYVLLSLEIVQTFSLLCVIDTNLGITSLYAIFRYVSLGMQNVDGHEINLKE